ncbi:MAG: hypothetical protein FWG99_11005 [Treponema sp.]|nr:hypothetical protein [Treponema sp.]
MTFGELIALYWLFGNHSPKEEPPAVKKGTIDDIEFREPTARGRKIGSLVFRFAFIAAIICLLTRHPFYALLAIFIALCGLIWPHIKVSAEQQESSQDESEII